MQIGDLSQRSGVNIETIRYYERIGILPVPIRQSNGRRIYNESDTQRLRFIRHARELGFDLASVRILLNLQENPHASCKEASRIAQDQLNAVEIRMARLMDLQAELKNMITKCNVGQVANCQIIEALTVERPRLAARRR